MSDIDVISSQQAVDLQGLSQYWTDEAIAQAEPIDVTIEEELLSALMAPEPWVQSGNLTIMESIAPDGESIEDYKEVITPQSGFVTKKVLDRTNIPFATVGKMFMTFNGRNFVGTGWVVAEKAVFTAGHCVFDRDNGGWADNILFIPQYENNNPPPVGRWTASIIHSLEGWTQNRDFKFDMGVFVVDRLIRPRTGSLGWMANYPPNQGPYNSIGYPSRSIAGYNFNGQHMWQSSGGYIQGSNPIQMHNNMTPGCSGGPWVVTRNARVYANGLNSFRYLNEPNTMYSPYFGDGFINLYNAVKDER